jgi:hypothetical protein
MAVLALYLLGPDRTFTVAGYRFGFQEAWTGVKEFTYVHAGPLGENYQVPLAPTACGLILAAALITVVLGIALRLGIIRIRRRPPA